MHYWKISWFLWIFVNNIQSNCWWQKHKCRMSTQWHIRPLYLCNFLENSVCEHTTFALQTIVIMLTMIINTANQRNRFSYEIQTKTSKNNGNVKKTIRLDVPVSVCLSVSLSVSLSKCRCLGLKTHLSAQRLPINRHSTIPKNLS